MKYIWMWMIGIGYFLMVVWMIYDIKKSIDFCKEKHIKFSLDVLSDGTRWILIFHAAVLFLTSFVTWLIEIGFFKESLSS